MRHRRIRRKMGVKTGHRKALLRNLVKSLVIYKKIRTTYAKAKEASAFADTVVTIAKRASAENSLHARRLLISKLGCPKTAGMLISQIAPKFKNRQGGYTRVLRLGTRPGDYADTALLEFTEIIELPKKPKKEKEERKDKKAAAPVKETKTVEKEKPAKQTSEKIKAKEDTKAAETKKTSAAKDKEPESEKKESEKKGGFLGALRKFLKGDEK